MTSLWLWFVLCAVLRVICGTNLSRYGDVIAEKTGMGRAWIGLVLMASVTSLPELITGISSVTIADTPDIAVGNVLGACVFNLFVIAVLDILHGRSPLFSRVEAGHILSAGFGIVLIGIVALSIIANQHVPSIGHLGLYTIIIAAVYATGVRSAYIYEKRKIAEFVEEMAETVRYGHISTKKAVMLYILNAAVIVAAATWLPFIGDRLATQTGLGRSFFGTIFIAVVTTLPELTVSISALRIGAADMAVGNLLGSNMFNIFILAIDDLFYVKGPLLSVVSSNHVMTGFSAMLMSAVSIIGLIYRPQKKTVLRLGADSIALIAAYIFNTYLLYIFRAAG